MKKFNLFLLITIVSIAGIYLLYSLHKKTGKLKTQLTVSYGATTIGDIKKPQNRITWEFNRLKDPETGTIPRDMREKELQFAKSLPMDANIKSLNWVLRGPYNIGGRTRGIAIDVNDEDTIIAGGVSGGVWRSTNGGTTWTKVTAPEQLHTVSCLIQDTRPGHTNVWYYGTGEGYGQSASAQGAYLLGNGIYKSTDNGLTWFSLSSTATNTPETFESFWDIVWNIAIDPSNDTLDIVYTATLGAIYRTQNGGNTWTCVLGGNVNNYSYFTDIAVTSEGVIYATLSSDGQHKGIWRSANGINWTNITPIDTFPPTYDRIVIGINPSNENEVYFLGVTPGYGQHSYAFFGYEEWNSLWKYTYISGDGSGSGGLWTNLSMNIPNNGISVFDNYYAQGSYNQLVAVKPDEPNVVFIGGTNLYRSTDGFTTMNNITQIGGYKIGTNLPDFHIYQNHHPDQHRILFLPSNPNIMISATDGGIFKTYNCMDSIVVWESLNRGYQTTQLYTVSIDENSTSEIIIGGFQDNGNFFTNSSDPQASWVMPLNGDGAFSAITPDFYLLSIQNGKVFKMTLDAQGYPTAFRRIDPIGGDDYLFINPFAVDPNNSNIMYLAEGTNLWRNDSLTFIPLTNTYDSISTGWFKFSDTIDFTDTKISAVAVSKIPANIVYYGTTKRRVYRIDNATTGDPVHTEITGNNFPSSGNYATANVGCIAIDPRDANKAIVVFTNYKLYSLFYTNNGGQSWIKVGGNLEQNYGGGGSGPSCRWATILPFGEKTIYLVGTSIGLFATDTLIAHTTMQVGTIWVQLGANTIGNVVVDMVKARETDNLVVVGTHGNGVYSTYITSIEDIVGIIEKSRQTEIKISVYPNPAYEKINFSFYLPSSANTKCIIYDKMGKLVEIIINGKILTGRQNLTVDLSKYKNGVYYFVVECDSWQKRECIPFIVTK